MSTQATRVWYQSMTPLELLPNYADSLRRHAKLVCPDLEVTVNGASNKWFEQHMPGQVFKYPYAKHVIQSEIIGICRRAQEQGYDVLVLGSFSEPFLAEIRSILDIPVVSMAESSLLVACSLAETFSLVGLSAGQITRLGHVVHRHSLDGRVREITSLTRPVHEADLDKAFHDPASIIEDFMAAARKASAAGADVIIPAEGVLNELLFWNKVREVDGSTVLDCAGLSLLYARMMVDMKRTLGVGVGRRWAYPKLPAEMLQMLDRVR